MEMEMDTDYELFKYLNQQADEYETLQEILDKNGVSFEEAKVEIVEFQEEIERLCAENAIGTENIVQMCLDLMERIEATPEDADLQYLYLCIMTDTGLLNAMDSDEKTEKQIVLDYFRQQKKIRELSAFLELNMENADKLNAFKAYLKKSIRTYHVDCTQELNLLMRMLSEHDYKTENPVFRDNLNALLMHINTDKRLKSAKPYILYAVISRKSGLIQNRANFFPNIKAVFQYQAYNILHDNGKNFNMYQSAIELYEHLRRACSDEAEVDMDFCDFCFANLSRQSEWYYTQCQIEYKLPMLFSRKLQFLKAYHFPVLFYADDYAKWDLDSFKLKRPKLYRTWEKCASEGLIREFLSALYCGSDIEICTEKLPESDEYPEYAEPFLYEAAAVYLEHCMLNVSQYFVKI